MSATKTYSRRLFLTYEAVVDGKPDTVESVVQEFASAHKGVDLEQPLTFAQWQAETKTPAKRVRAVQ